MRRRGSIGWAIIDFWRWWLALPLALLCGAMLYIALWLFARDRDYTLDDLI